MVFSTSLTCRNRCLGRGEKTDDNLKMGLQNALTRSIGISGPPAPSAAHQQGTAPHLIQDTASLFLLSKEFWPQHKGSLTSGTLLSAFNSM